MEILAILMLVVCGVFWYVCRGELRFRQAEEQEWVKESMLCEAEGVIMDFLDYGREVSLATKGAYRGTISVRMHSMNKTGEMMILVSMYDSGDLNQLDESVLSSLHLHGFVKKYGYYYDRDRNSVVYQTSRGVQIQPGEKEVLTRKLMQRIRNHPMAVIKTDSMIYTRGIGQKEGNSR